ncbi:AraC family transcriptional regulator [Phytohabitans kaempferiae]|uniref:AraC family transcriptional regulator n=1 Tax=Phytohabitans kaempferiae TaxID=1620943 RepID=A0ABV6MH41_9ACTN
MARHFYSNFIDRLDPSETLATRLTVGRLGPVTVGDVRFGTDLRIKLDELGSYHVDVLLSGQLVWQQGGSQPLLATGTTAAVFQPVGNTVLDLWTGDCRVLAVKIDRAALEDRLARMLDAPVRTPIQLGREMDTTGGPGRSWARLAGLLAAEVGDDGGLAHHALLSDHLQETLLEGLLLATDHPYRERLDGLGRPDPAPRAVRRVVDAVQAHPERPYTVARLAGIAEVSERSLQNGFQSHMGMSPTAYLRQVRLARVHDELRQATPLDTTVADVAYRWGFVHLGRFANAYRQRYGESPSQSLRSRPRSGGSV